MSTKYQPNAPMLALHPDRDGFIDAICEGARVIRASGVVLPRPDQQFLADLLRDEPRYQFRAFRRLLDVAARCRDVAERVAVLDLLRGFQVARTIAGPLCAHEASRREQNANAVLDLVQLDYERWPHELEVLDKGLISAQRQIAATEQLLQSWSARRSEVATGRRLT